MAVNTVYVCLTREQAAVNRTNTESALQSGTAVPRLKMPPCGRNAYFGPFQQKSSKPVS